jgi:uncharacterized membrane protein YbjE (DUF340 family)
MKKTTNMWIILIILFAGTLAGYAFSRLKAFNKITDAATMYIIYVLLFFMGLSVGTKPEIMKNLASIGFDALIIAAFAIGGSILTAFFLHRYLFRRNEE